MRENVKKMREKKKEREELKASRPKSLLVSKKFPLLQCTRSLYTAPSKAKLQKKKKKTKPKAITGDKMGRKPKWGTRVKNSNGQQEQCRRVEK